MTPPRDSLILERKRGKKNSLIRLAVKEKGKKNSLIRLAVKARGSEV